MYTLWFLLWCQDSDWRFAPVTSLTALVFFVHPENLGWFVVEKLHAYPFFLVLHFRLLGRAAAEARYFKVPPLSAIRTAWFGFPLLTDISWC